MSDAPSPARPSGVVDNPDVERAMLFDLRMVAPDHFRALPIPSSLPRLYGGQVVAQALAAVQQTATADRWVHSCHAYFVRPGRLDHPIDFLVDRDRDGRSFSSRRVRVLQDGELILNMAASLHVPEDGYDWQLPMPSGLPEPEALVSMSAQVHAAAEQLPVHLRPFWLRDHLFDWRPVEPFMMFDGPPRPPQRHFWIRKKHPLGDDWGEHQRFFAYVSDLHILHTGLLPLGLGWAEPTLQAASLDHAIWFHRQFRVDDWFLYALDSTASIGVRSLGRGTVYDRDGRIVASVTQEGLARVLPERREKDPQ